MTPLGVAAAPVGARGRFVPLEVKKTLSWAIAALSRDGGREPSSRRKYDSIRVSSWNSPSATPRMSP